MWSLPLPTGVWAAMYLYDLSDRTLLRVAPRIVRIYTLSLSASHETAVELVLAVEEDVVPPDRADMGQ